MMRLAEPSTALPGPKSPSLGSYRLAYSTSVLPWAELAQTNSRVLLADRVLHRQALTLSRLVMWAALCCLSQQLASTPVRWILSRRDRYNSSSPLTKAAPYDPQHEHSQS